MNDITQAMGIPSHLTNPESDLPKAKSAFGKEDFMKLLMTQLQHQDPLNPLDHREFSAQLAQFSSLEQLSNIGSGIQSLKGEMGEDSKLQALSFIGKRVQASGGEIDFKENVSARMLSSSSQGGAPVSRAVILDSNGTAVREIKNDGKPDMIWDGKDSNGREVALGKYQFRLYRNMPDGQEKEISSEVSGKVTGVELEGRTPVLLVATERGNQRLDLAKVRSVDADTGSEPKAPAMAGVSVPVPEAKPSAPVTVAAAPKAEVAEESAESNFDTSSFERPARGWNFSL